MGDCISGCGIIGEGEETECDRGRGVIILYSSGDIIAFLIACDLNKNTSCSLFHIIAHPFAFVLGKPDDEAGGAW